ncbi:CRISPR-associated endonuclease Cas1 [Buchananella hordeovulneris]|uniref:CRISPR-associated endonuclease Cas1 n=1 Tax=Buchananella hordeovulneris TaxID=52770 RepID=A0A1Q5PUX9_9ACTO|nr:CRISPR-associated endonuclease Cas1 [Buchananella hordeovulneris]OKL51306.1 CRISPR-associated endonuclease Cas1 [Buchananella hordeovulneris]
METSVRHLGELTYPLRASAAFQRQALTGEPDLLTEIAAPDSLLNAWRYVFTRDAKDGYLLQQSQQIAADPDRFVAALSGALLSGRYQPEPQVEVLIPKKGKTSAMRELSIPSIRDRVVERAVLNAIIDRADLLQCSASFAFRRGLGVQAATHEITQLRDSGNRYVLLTDIANYFGRINIADSLRVLQRGLFCSRTLALLRFIAKPRRVVGRRRIRSRGLAQGSCLSPLLANLALTDIDFALADTGVGYVRFADDILLCAPSRTELAASQRLLASLAAHQGLQLNEEKTMHTSFDAGFCYLGVDFTAHQPVTDLHYGVKHTKQPAKVLYVGQDGARVSLTRERLVITGPDTLPQVSVPRRLVSRIVLSGNVGLSAGARNWALFNEIDVICLSRRGSYLGQMTGLRSALNASRLLRQAEFAANPAARLPLAKQFVGAKLNNQLHMLHRLGRRSKNIDVADTCVTIRGLTTQLPDATTVDEVRGLEGQGSALYFPCAAELLPTEMWFAGRSRRPPRDVANAALSYGYAILLGECTAALYAAGLEPSLGLLHASTDKRPSLSLDLMEEFRPLLVDRVVWSLLRLRRLRAEHGTASPDGDGVWLTNEGKRILVDGYEAMLQRSVKGSLPGFAGTWRRHIHHQAQRLAHAIFDPVYSWSAAAWR